WLDDHDPGRMVTAAVVAPIDFAHRVVDDFEAARERRAHCTTDHVKPAPPKGDHVALLVGGLGSTSDNAAVDGVPTADLGYDPSEVFRFSYAGGLVSGNPYTAHDTLGELE